MLPTRLSCLLATTILTVSASAAFAAPAKPAASAHTFGGSIKATLSSSSNIGKALANPSGGAPADDDEDEFSLEDEFDNTDELDEVLEELDVDQEDLDEDDINAAFLDDADIDDNVEDDDGDGIPDPVPAGKPSNTDGDAVFQKQFALKHGYSFENTNMSWKSGATGVLSDNRDRDDLSKTSWGVNTGPEFNLKEYGVKINPSVSFLNLNVDSNSQLQSTVGSLGVSWKATKSLGLTARYSHEERNNQKPRTTDLQVDAIKLGSAYVWGKNLFKADVGYKIEDNQTNLKDKDGYGFGLGYSRKLPWKWQADVSGSYGFTDFTDLNPNREDESYKYGFKFTKKLDKGFFFDFGGVNSLKEVNIRGKNSRNSTAFVSAGYTF